MEMDVDSAVEILMPMASDTRGNPVREAVREVLAVAARVRELDARSPDVGPIRAFLLGEEFKDPNLTEDPCPRCGEPIRLKWSGVECSSPRCGWWRCA